jgi:two-component system sensor histidine kinase VicK
MIVKRRTVGVIYADSRKRIPQELRRSQPLLEALGSQAAVAIENARLYEEERQRSEMIATVAHELKSPLTAVLGYLSIIQESSADLPPELREYVNIVFDQSERLARMVRNILDLRAIEASSALWSMTSVPVAELLQEALVGLRPIAEINKIAVEVDLPDRPADIFGSRDRIQQVVTNLFTNAVKFTPPGGHIRLHADIVPFDAVDSPRNAEELGPLVHPASHDLARLSHFISPSRCVRIGVSDNGPGIVQADISRIFDKFTQGSLEKRGARGLGLGLSIAREIVERHGGRIWVESEPGVGSTFLFTLPLMDRA